MLVPEYDSEPAMSCCARPVMLQGVMEREVLQRMKTRTQDKLPQYAQYLLAPAR